MESAEIRSRWLRFFEERGHTVVPSASLIADDPTLLLVPAGMVPFKPYFLGEVKPPFPRATSVQKCVRTPDIEEVGKTTRHGTFFQMCGNFSFGDYFKEGAIRYAWELLTALAGRRRLRAGPGEAVDHRLPETTTRPSASGATSIGVPAERIQRLGMDDNYWSMGVPGPCGPCSEINYDRGPEFGAEGGPAVNDERYVEIWNLVFMQYERGAGDRQGRLPDPRRPARPEHRHRPRPGTPRDDPAGRRRTCTRSTPRASIIDRATELTGKAVRRRPRLRRLAARRRRPHAHRRDAHRRRRHPRQRGPRLRAAPHHAPRHPQHAAAGRRRADRRASWSTPSSRRWARSTRSWRTTASASRRSRSPRRPPSSRRCGPAPTSWTPPSPTPRPAGSHGAAGRQGVPAPRHLGLPDRPHPGDGLRAGPVAWTRTASAA